MLSINQKKYVNSLKQKKFRNQHQTFIVEGVKMVEELLNSDYEVEIIFATEIWISNNNAIHSELVSDKELASISSLKTPNEILAVAKMKQQQDVEVENQLTLALDKLQDPGNMGTIIRTSDWFGITTIVCSKDSVDIYNPKVIQATMGSFFRVNVVYLELVDFFNDHKELTVYGALLDGENMHDKDLSDKNAVLLMGNESKGISEELIPFITDKIFIPRHGKAESLNVATATAIISSQIKKFH